METTFTTTTQTSTSVTITTSESSQGSTTTENLLLPCSKRDGRGVLWEGEPEEQVEKSCDEGSFKNETFTEGTIFI